MIIELQGFDPATLTIIWLIGAKCFQVSGVSYGKRGTANTWAYAFFVILGVLSYIAMVLFLGFRAWT